MMRLRLLLLLALLGVGAASAQQELPDFGENTVVSLSQERMLGRAWLMSFRSQAPIASDPIVQDYLETLIFRLAEFSELKSRDLELVVVHNRAINAFAVPGGVVGVHDGLLLSAETEAQLASVLGHELAHLSQRHFARGVENQQKAAAPTLAGMLAGLVLVAAGNADAGMATVMGTQAAAMQQQLRYSRLNEQEADRIGMQNLERAGFDPNATSAMFELMQRESRRYGARPPEFLLTHPLTENRISDAKNRARQYPQLMYEDNLEFQLVRTRIEKSYFEDNAGAVAHFRDKLARKGKNAEAAQYGLILALTEAGEFAEARKLLRPLRKFSPASLIYAIAELELDVAAGEYHLALERGERGMKLVPDNYPITMAMVNTEFKARNYHRAEEVLQDFSRQRERDPHVWYVLAEMQGLSGNTLGLHQSRARYFVLTGRLQQAETQLGYARALAHDGVTKDRIETQMRYIAEIRRALKQL